MLGSLPVFQTVLDFFLHWYWIPLLVINLSVIITILIENGNPPKTMAWILVIVFLPIIGILLYFFFGQQFQRQKYFKKISEHFRSGVFHHWNELTGIIQHNLIEIENEIGDYAEVYKYLNNTKTSPPTTKNHVKLLINGEEKFPEFLKALDSAKDHIHLEYYIFEPDKLGKQIIDLLIQKAKEGVTVRVIVDDLGSPALVKRRKIFEGTGVEFQVILPVRFNSLANSNFRDHRKILIVDDRVAFIGGINISDRYDNSESGNRIFWRDTAVKIEGTAIHVLQLRFWLSWMMTNGKPFELNQPRYLGFRPLPTPQKTYVSFAVTTPGGKINSAMESLILAVNLARTKIQLCTPYFIPTEPFKTALMIAASKGVQIEMMIPEKGDSFFVQNASLSFLKPLMKRGLKVFLYQKGFIHAKTVNVDDTLAFVGTVNLDSRSFFINFEITAIIHNRRLLDRLAAQFEEDKKDCAEMTLGRWNAISPLKRGYASVCRLLAPIL